MSVRHYWQLRPPAAPCLPMGARHNRWHKPWRTHLLAAVLV